MGATVVLVHGGCSSEDSWQRVVPLLAARDLSPVALTLPSCRPSSDVDDVSAVRSVLDGLEPPVVLVGHSYGGMVISEAGDHPAVGHLVYLDALVPDEGDTAFDHMRGIEPGFAACYRMDVESRTGWFDPEALESYLRRRGWSGADTAAFMPTMRPQRFDASVRRTTSPAWRTMNSTFIGCADSEVPAASRVLFATRVASAMEIPGDHFPQWLRPETVAQIVASVADEMVPARGSVHG